MKEKFYSSIVKCVLYILCAVSFGGCVFSLFYATGQYSEVYCFEDDVSDSQYADSELTQASGRLERQYLSDRSDAPVYSDEYFKDFEYCVIDADGNTIAKNTLHSDEAYFKKAEFHTIRKTADGEKIFI